MTVAAHTLSVCMPNYNGADLLPRALDALLAQAYPPLEILVLDDGSTDSSLDLLQGYERREAAVRVLRHERNEGAIKSLLDLIDAARGTHVLFAAVDDVVLPGLLERSMEMLDRHPAAGLCSSLTRMIDDDGDDRGILPSPMVSTEPAYIPPAAIPKLLPLGIVGWFVAGNTAVYSLEAVRSVGPRCVEVGPYWDGLMSQVIALERGACFIPEPLAFWRFTDESYSGRMRGDPAWQRTIAEEAYPLMTADFGHLFPAGYAASFRQEVRAQAELDARDEGRLARLRSEMSLRRRHGLPLRPAIARRLRFRLDERRRRRLDRATR